MNKLYFLLLVLFALLFTSCGRNLYEPAPINVTGIKEKNDVNLSLRLSGNVNMSAAYSPLKNMIVVLNHNAISRTPSDELLFSSNTGLNFHNTNFGLGFYKKLGTDFFVEGQSTMGRGKFRVSKYEDTIETKLNVFENNLVLYVSRNLLDFGIAGQYKRYIFSDKIQGEVPRGIFIPWSEHIQNNLDTDLFEFAFFTKIKAKHVDIEIQYGKSFNLTEENIGISNSSFGSLGLGIKF